MSEGKGLTYSTLEVCILGTKKDVEVESESDEEEEMIDKENIIRKRTSSTKQRKVKKVSDYVIIIIIYIVQKARMTLKQAKETVLKADGNLIVEQLNVTNIYSL